MTVTAALADAGSAKLYDMVAAVPEQTLTAYDDEDVVVPATAVVIAGDGSVITGRDAILAAYAHALAAGYQVGSYGDAMLLAGLEPSARGPRP